MSNVNPRPVKACVTCGGEFNPSHAKQAACSRACIPKKGRTHLVCPCGVSTGSYQKRYCSPEHHELYRKPTREPARQVTRICLGCGEEFTRPHWYPGKMNYCSNKCSHSQQKKVRDKYILNLNEHAVVFHSGWEIRFYAAALRFDIPIRSYDGPDIITSLGTYRPDFIINDTPVDVKGWLRPESEIKCKEAGIRLVTKEDLLFFEEHGWIMPVNPMSSVS